MAVHAGKAGVVKAGSDAVGEVAILDHRGSRRDRRRHVHGCDMAHERRHPALLDRLAHVLVRRRGPPDRRRSSPGSTITLEVMPTGETTGEAVYSGGAIITAVSRTAAVDGVIEATFSFTGDGALTAGTVSI